MASFDNPDRTRGRCWALPAPRQAFAEGDATPAVFCGICAGAPGLELMDALKRPAEIRQFWRGYALVGAVSATLLLIELFMLPAPRVQAPAGSLASAAAQPTAGRR